MSCQLRIVMLNDNQAEPGFAAEHGFALLVEMDRKRILFDCGKDAGILTANAAAAGVDLSGIGGLILSHGHYDHTGGIPCLLEAVPSLPVYCHPGIRKTRYSIRDAPAPRRSRYPRDPVSLWITCRRIICIWCAVRCSSAKTFCSAGQSPG